MVLPYNVGVVGFIVLPMIHEYNLHLDLHQHNMISIERLV